ncbi:MAG: NOB1 family endonuclease [Candidatus Bathyarchaeota archaeon]|nr:NOB1 family endonuclease [Candidatus Bathyarchaeota archaeon]
MPAERKSIVLDASAFIAGLDPLDLNEETYSVPEVGDELLEGSMPKIRFETSLNSRKLKVINPENKYIKYVKLISREAGDLRFLSKADLSVLALALQLKDMGRKPVIATDDYSIQNVAEKMGLEYTSLANLGIRYQLKWLLYCPACGKKYPPDEKLMICGNCGTELKRKHEKRTPVKRRAQR